MNVSGAWEPTNAWRAETLFSLRPLDSVGQETVAAGMSSRKLTITLTSFSPCGQTEQTAGQILQDCTLWHWVAQTDMFTGRGRPTLQHNTSRVKYKSCVRRCYEKGLTVGVEYPKGYHF